MAEKDFGKPFKCGCCLGTYPSMHQHVHHKNPRALGGKDTEDNRINLCPQCHDAIHSTAWKLANKRHSEAKVIDSVRLIYKENQDAAQRCIELALKVRNAMLLGKERELSPDTVVAIGTNIRKRHKTLVAARVSELRTTQENYIRGLILSDLIKRYNLNISVAEENMLIKRLK